MCCELLFANIMHLDSGRLTVYNILMAGGKSDGYNCVAKGKA